MASNAGLDLLSVEELRQLLGDEALVSKVLSAAAAKVQTPGRANHTDVSSNMPPDNPSRRVDILDIEDVINKARARAHSYSHPIEHTLSTHTHTHTQTHTHTHNLTLA
jgi:hypothetical protein